MFVALKCQILCNGQCNLRRDQTLYDRIICQIQEHTHMIGYTAFFKCLTEEIGYVVFYAHRCKYDRKFFIRIISQRCLLYDLCRQLIMRKSIAGKDRQLLSTDQSGQTINCRNTCTDIVTRIFTAYRIQRQTIDISLIRRKQWSQSIDRYSDSVKCSSQHIR